MAKAAKSKNKFASYTFQQANEAFNGLKLKLEKVRENREYVKGNDWQGGKGWVGPQFEGNTQVSKDLWREIEREFASKGSIRSCVRRKTRGVIGRIPTWQISSRNAPADSDSPESKAIQERIEEAQKILNEFWKNSRVHRTLKRYVHEYETSGYSIVRLFFVQDGENEAEPIQTIEDAVKKIELFYEEPDQGIVLIDRETLAKASLFRYEKDGRVYIEMCYVDDEGMTVFKKFSQNDGKDFAQSSGLSTLANNIADELTETDGIELPLNQKLLIFALEGESMISTAMRSQQKIVNKGVTMMSHNLDVDGYRSRLLLNALPPGDYQTQPDGKRVFVPDPNGLDVGAGKIQYAQGLPIIEREGGTGDRPTKITTNYSTPGVFESQPIDVKTYIDTIKTGSDSILEEADQLHVAITGDANASGESLKQQRDGYKGSLDDTKSLLDDEGSEIFETVLSIVAYLMGEDDRYIDLQVSFSAVLNPGPVSSEERKAAQDEFKNGVRTLESTMEETGIVDPDAMKAKKAVESESELNRLSTALDVINKAPGSLSLIERRRILFPNKTEAEHLEDIKQLAKEDPTIAAAYGIEV